MQLPQPANSTGAANFLTLVMLLPTLASCGSDAATATVESREVPEQLSPPERPVEVPLVRSNSSSPEFPADSSGASLPVERPSSNSGRLLDKTFDDIKFEIEPDAPFDRSMLTPEIESLSGKRIRIRGYILPTAQKRGIKQFVLVRDNQECCFGPGAALYDCILVTMNLDKSAEFTIRPVAVEGQFEVKVFKPLDRTLAVFHLQGEAVKAGK